MTQPMMMTKLSASLLVAFAGLALPAHAAEVTLTVTSLTNAAGSCSAGNCTTLQAAINAANADTANSYVINFNVAGGGTLSLGTASSARMLPILTNPSGISINGANLNPSTGTSQGGITINGGRSNTSTTAGDRIFFIGVSSDTANGTLRNTTTTNYAISNLTLANGNARGGIGGGAGLGGAIFMNAGHLSLSGVTFANNAAIGGVVSPFSAYPRGGGGMGGNGEYSGGGGFGRGANGGRDAAGLGGAFTGGAGGGASGVAEDGCSGFAGGASGGGGGGCLTRSTGGGGGGVGGANATAAGGGAGGFGGGGGGGSSGGQGGFGGGGGSAAPDSSDPSARGGDGGFGGGGGGASSRAGGGAGKGGFGGGNGATSTTAATGLGGGGAGLGGAVFVRQGATVTFTDGGMSGGVVAGGTGSGSTAGASPGQGIGSGIFLAGAATYNVTAGKTVSITDSIGGGNDAQITGGFTKNGAGTLELKGANTYVGGTTVSAGTLLANNTTGSATGSGVIQVGPGGLFGGTGTVWGAVNVASGGTLAPGASPGTLNTGSVNLSAGSFFAAEIDASGSIINPNTDLINVSGTISLGGSTLALSVANLTVLTSNPQTFLLFANDLSDAITGQFGSITGLAPGYSAWINYGFAGTDALGRIGDGNDLAVILKLNSPDVTPVPGPLPVLGVLAAFGWSRKLRRRIRDAQAA